MSSIDFFFGVVVQKEASKLGLKMDGRRRRRLFGKICNRSLDHLISTNIINVMFDLNFLNINLNIFSLDATFLGLCYYVFVLPIEYNIACQLENRSSTEVISQSHQANSIQKKIERLPS